jgi:hypothetical protein
LPFASSLPLLFLAYHYPLGSSHSRSSSFFFSPPAFR